MDQATNTETPGLRGAGDLSGQAREMRPPSQQIHLVQHVNIAPGMVHQLANADEPVSQPHGSHHDRPPRTKSAGDVNGIVDAGNEVGGSGAGHKGQHGRRRRRRQKGDFFEVREPRDKDRCIIL